MKFCCKTPFSGEKGMFSHRRSMASSGELEDPDSDIKGVSYKPLRLYEEYEKPQSRRSVVEEFTNVDQEDSMKGHTQESSHSNSKLHKEKPHGGHNVENVTRNKKKKGVSGPSMGHGESVKASDIRVPKYEKNEESEKLIRKAIRENEFLKEGLFACEDVIKAVVNAMYLKTVAAGTHIIREGEVGYHMYVCAQGKIEVFKKSVKVNTLGPGKVFGELALLYHSKRNATILAVTPCKLWVLDQKVYLQIMKKSGLQMTESRVKFLRSVPLLSELDTEVLVKMTDLLKLRSFPGGTEIIKQGDEGSLFYIITGGTVSVTVTQADGSVTQGGVLKAGDFFGEKALIKNVRRAATITALDPGVECLTLDRDHFIEYLGGLQKVKDGTFDKRVPKEEDTEPEYRHVHLADLDTVGILGIGGFGRVELVRWKKDKNVTFALKCVKKVDVVDLGQEQHMLNEKENMMICRSPFIVRMYNTYKSPKYLYFLMEVCLGGDVFGLLQKRKFFDEHLARFTTACVVEAFGYLHDRGIAYRDLKPENVIYNAKGYAKLVSFLPFSKPGLHEADFGFSKKLGPTAKTWTFVGTPEYVAPEIIQNEGHNWAVDYWTLGIFLHELLCGKTPFKTSSNTGTFSLISKGIDSVTFPKFLSKTVQLLIKKLCKRVPAERLGNQREGVNGIRKHKWFQNFHWESLQNTTMKSPYLPKITGPTDLSHFDKYVKEKEIPPDEFGDWDANF